MTQVATVRQRFYNIQGRYEGVLKDHAKLVGEIEQLDKSIELKNQTFTTLSHLIDKMVKSKMLDMDRLVSYGLTTVFPDRNVEFKSEIRNTGKRLTIELKTMDNGSELDDDSWGAVSVVESFLLRLLCLLKLHKPRLLLLDETFAAVGSSYINNVGALIGELAKRLGVDVLLVTHNPGVSDARVLVASMKDNELILSEGAANA